MRKETIELYHFCSSQHHFSIKTSGLLYGKIPMISKKGNLKGLWSPAQWLTSNPDPEAQDWSEGTGQLPYNRTDIRITVELPTDDPALVKWLDLCQRREFKHTARELNRFGDPENWYVYMGTIHPMSFRKTKHCFVKTTT